MPDDDEIFNDFSPYDILAGHSEQILNLHRINQAQAMQISQLMTLMTQINSQMIVMSERLWRLEDDGR